MINSESTQKHNIHTKEELMNEKSVLKVIKNCTPKMRLSRQKTLAACVQGTVKNPRGKLTEMARGMNGNIQLRDRLKRLSRFIGNESVSIEESGKQILKWLLARQGYLMPVVVLIDWTREHRQNVLMLSLKWGQRSVPFYWDAVRDGEFKGQLVKMETKALRLLRQWLPGRKVIVVADRGYSRQKFYKELKSQKLDYIVRVPNETHMISEEYTGAIGKVRLRGNHVRDFKEVKQSIKAKLATRIIIKQEKIKGKWARWNLSTSLTNERKETIVSYYERRMGIEASFKDLKTTLGWRHQKRIEVSSRVSRYLLILVMAMVCALITSERGSVQQMKRYVSLVKGWKGTTTFSFVQIGLWLIQKLNPQSSMIHPRKVLTCVW